MLAGVDTHGNPAVVAPLVSTIKDVTGKDSGPSRKGRSDAITYITAFSMENSPLMERHGRRHIQIKLETIGIVGLEVGCRNLKLS